MNIANGPSISFFELCSWFIHSKQFHESCSDEKNMHKSYLEIHTFFSHIFLTDFSHCLCAFHRRGCIECLLFKFTDNSNTFQVKTLQINICLLWLPTHQFVSLTANVDGIQFSGVRTIPYTERIEPRSQVVTHQAVCESIFQYKYQWDARKWNEIIILRVERVTSYFHFFEA